MKHISGLSAFIILLCFSGPFLFAQNQAQDQPPLPEVQFEFSQGEMLEIAGSALDQARESIQQIIDVQGERTFKNTVEAFDVAIGELDRVTIPLIVMETAAPTPEIKNEAVRVLVLVEKFKIEEVFLNRELQDALHDYKAMEKPEILEEEEAALLEAFLDDFRREGGMGLDEEAFERFKEQKIELAQLGTRGVYNLGINDNHVWVTPEELGETSDSFQGRLEERADGRVKVNVTSDYAEFMADGDANAARRLYFQFQTVESPWNRALLERMLTLRALIVGPMLEFENWAAFKAAKNIAGTPDKVETFLGKVSDGVLSTYEEERELLLAYYQRWHPEATEVPPWRLANVAKSLKEDLFRVNSQEVTNYFPHDLVRVATPRAMGTAYQFRIEELQGVKVWHPTVKVVRVWDSRTDMHLGDVFLDLYQRRGKFGHGQALEVIPGGMRRDGAVQRPVGIIFGNWPNPELNPGVPCLVSFGHVSTYVHEWGHMIQLLSSMVKYRRTNGFNLQWDYAEVPSMGAELLLEDPKFISDISRHYETGASMPPGLLLKMIGSQRLFLAADRMLLAYRGLLDQAIHSRGAHVDVKDVEREIHQRVLGRPLTAGTDYPSRWIHMMDEEYSGEYYVYPWSDWLALALHEEVKKAGGYKRGGSVILRDKLFQYGGMRKAESLIKSVIGVFPPPVDPFIAPVLNKGIEPRQLSLVEATNKMHAAVAAQAEADVTSSSINRVAVEFSNRFVAWVENTRLAIYQEDMENVVYEGQRKGLTFEEAYFYTADNMKWSGNFSATLLDETTLQSLQKLSGDRLTVEAVTTVISARLREIAK